MSRVTRTIAARRDIKELTKQLATLSGSLDLATRYLDRMMERCALYAAEPEMGELCSELGNTVRRFSFENYVIYYRPAPSGIQLLRVFTVGAIRAPSAE
jgi:plasmid stabilization system protein ParE